MSCCFGITRSSSRRRRGTGTGTQAAGEDETSRELPVSSPTTINLTNHEYSCAVQSQSFTEIWSKIHCTRHSESTSNDEDGCGGGDETIISAHLISSVLQPDRASIEQVLSGIPPTSLTRLVADYFANSEHTSHLCFDLHRSVERARSLYFPLHLVLELLSQIPEQLSQAQCDWAFDKFLNFDNSANPFPPPEASNFQNMHRCFEELKTQLDMRLYKAKKRISFYKTATRGSALCLIGSAVGLAVVGLVIATHALVALVAGPPVFLAFLQRPTLPLATGRRKLEEHVWQMEAAAKGTFVLNNDLDTIEKLVSRLHATVESDKNLVRLVTVRGKGERLGYPIEEVVRQLGKTRDSFEQQLGDLEEHICLCFAAVNRARSLLLQHIHSQHP